VIEKELGRGSMGVVYRAWQPRLARRVALKVISGGPASQARVRDYWLREAHSGARVRDPRVVQIHDVGEANECLYLVLEYSPGGSLKDRLDGPLPATSAASLVEQLAGGVAAVHRAGLLHLDLKPSNILLDSDRGTPWESSAPKVSDFGIARDADDPGMTHTSLRGPWGTPSYMAPEQVDPGRLTVGPASDVYALGAILYELLTGRPPFRSASLAETMDQIRHQEPAPPRRLNAVIPQDLETICTTCLRKDPKRRYPTAVALADDLRRWQEGRPITARPISAAERAWRSARRRPLTAALGAGLAATLFAGVLSLTVLWRQAERERQRAEGLHQVARANYEVASQSLREICEFTYQAILDATTEWNYPSYLDRALEQTRARQIELSRKNALEPSGQEQLATIDLMLAEVYRDHHKPNDVVRPLLNESIALWEARIAQGADPDKARGQQLKALICLATLSYDMTNEAEVRRWDKTSSSIYRQLSGNTIITGRLFGLSLEERRLADYLADVGQGDRARRFLQDKLNVLEPLLALHHDSPDLMLARTLTLTALGTPDRTSLPSCLGRRGDITPGGSLHTMLVESLAELTARTFGLRTLGPFWKEQAHTDQDCAVRAEDAVRFLVERTTQLGLDESAVPVVGWRMRELIVSAASHLRALGKNEEACRNARLFRALAAALIRKYPRRAEPYLLLCEAHLQDAKNAQRTGDRSTVGPALRLSLEAAAKAHSIDPNSVEARRFVIDRRGRLAAFQSHVN